MFIVKKEHFHSFILPFFQRSMTCVLFKPIRMEKKYKNEINKSNAKDAG